MKKNKVFVLLLGKSGVGKTTIADYMERNYGLKQVVSYTNRPQRFEGEVGHKFLTEQNVEKIKEIFPNMVAADTYDGHFYFATAEQVDECDVYVINPSAVEQFKASYHGDKLIKVVQIEDLPENIVKHMLQRGGRSLTPRSSLARASCVISCWPIQELRGPRVRCMRRFGGGM